MEPPRPRGCGKRVDNVPRNVTSAMKLVDKYLAADTSVFVSFVLPEGARTSSDLTGVYIGWSI